MIVFLYKYIDINVLDAMMGVNSLL